MLAMSKNLDKAADLLRQGEVVGMPTETVYGLAARIDQKQALEMVFRLKKRPSFDPLIVHVAAIDDAKKLVRDWPLTAQTLAEKFWPGPLTMVLPKQDTVSEIISAGLDTVGIRMPANKITRELIEKNGSPLAAPSANLFSKVSPTRREHVLQDFPDLFVLEGGECQHGIESTVVGVTAEKVTILRPGVITKDDLIRALPNIEIDRKQSLAAPGNIDRHYQPNHPLFILDESVDLEAFLKDKKFSADRCLTLDLPDEAVLAARVLYARLRETNNQDIDCIVVFKTEKRKGGLWNSLWDRINRAAYK